MNPHDKISELEEEIEILKVSIRNKSMKITQLEGLISEILQIIKSLI
jgi:predicted RNase H-like nuclease (RuvC/YqgF family)